MLEVNVATELNDARSIHNSRGCETGISTDDVSSSHRGHLPRQPVLSLSKQHRPASRATLNCAPANKINPEVYAQNKRLTETLNAP